MADSLHASLLRAQGYQVGRWYITPFLAPFDREIYESKLILFMAPPPLIVLLGVITIIYLELKPLVGEGTVSDLQVNSHQYHVEIKLAGEGRSPWIPLKDRRSIPPVVKQLLGELRDPLWSDWHLDEDLSNASDLPTSVYEAAANAPLLPPPDNSSSTAEASPEKDDLQKSVQISD